MKVGREYLFLRQVGINQSNANQLLPSPFISSQPPYLLIMPLHHSATSRRGISSNKGKGLEKVRKVVSRYDKKSGKEKKSI